MASSVLVERRGPVQWITIDRPDRRTLLGRCISREPIDAREALAAFRAKRAPVRTGR